MGLQIIKQGVLNTVQDAGRFGFAGWGINPGGVMDTYASRVANALVGNTLDEAVLEIHFPAGEIVFKEPALASITGADFSPALNDQPIPLWRPVLIPKDGLLRFSKKAWGERCYLAVHGGFGTTRWLGSSSTNLKIGAGGNGGRVLKANDTIGMRNAFAIEAADGRPVLLPWSVKRRTIYENADEISFIEGPEWDWLKDESKEEIARTSFVIKSSSDRMGYHLSPGVLQFKVTEDLVSTAVTFGTLQAMPDGNILILMADHQTTGGYPRIGHVTSADLPKLSQRGANSSVTLKKISREQAEKMVISLGQQLRAIRESCKNNLANYHAKHRFEL
jgi:antagonist of KipI